MINPFIKLDPLWQWIQEEENKRKRNNETYYLWDAYDVAAVLMAEMLSDEANYAEYDYALWLALRLKFVQDEYLPFVQHYLETRERDYLFKIDGEGTIFECMIKDGLGMTYPEALAYYIPLTISKDPWIVEENGEQIQYCWGFELMPSDHRENQGIYILLDEDGKGYHKMTYEQKYIDTFKKEIGEPKAIELLKMPPDELKKLFPDIRRKLEAKREIEEKNYEIESEQWLKDHWDEIIT